MPGKGKKSGKNRKIKPDLDSPKKRYANAGKQNENSLQKLTEKELDNGFVVFDTESDAFDQDGTGRSSIFENNGAAGLEGFGEEGQEGPDNLPALQEQEEKKDDPWAKKENWQEYVTEKPEPQSFLMKSRFENEYSEKTTLSPVFESHTIYVNTGLHSFMGLRYTKFDRKRGRLARKRIQIGFGSQSGIINQGRLINESKNIASISSETPISMDRFENVVGALERTNENVDRVGKMGFFGRLFKSGKAKGTEFSGKYNLLTNNCNDFVISMAKAAGAETPAALHKSILGPIAAWKNLANASEEEELAGGTHIFYGARIEDGERNALLTDFMSQVRNAAKADGINISKVPELEDILLRLNDRAHKLGTMSDKNGTGKETEADLAAINADIRRALRFTAGKKHPRLNSKLLKFEALTRKAGQLTSDPNNIENLTKEEIDDAMSRRTPAEAQMELQQHEGAGSRISDRELFQNNNVFGEGRLTPTGELFLMSVGAGKMIKSLDMGSNVDKASHIREVADIFSGNNIDKAKPFLDRYIKDRPYLSTDQAAKLLTLSIEQGMGLGGIAITQANIWSVDRDDMGYMDYREAFVNAVPAKAEQLDESNRLYTALLYIISVIRGDKVQKEKDER